MASKNQDFFQKFSKSPVLVFQKESDTPPSSNTANNSEWFFRPVVFWLRFLGIQIAKPQSVSWLLNFFIWTLALTMFLVHSCNCVVKFSTLFEDADGKILGETVAFTIIVQTLLTYSVQWTSHVSLLILATFSLPHLWNVLDQLPVRLKSSLNQSRIPKFLIAAIILV